MEDVFLGGDKGGRGWFAPEMGVWTGRGFAGGWFGGAEGVDV